LAKPKYPEHNKPFNFKITTSIEAKYSRLPKPTKIDDYMDLRLIPMFAWRTAHYSLKPRTILVCSADARTLADRSAGPVGNK